MIFHSLPKTQKKQCSGCTSDILRLIKTQNGAAMSVGRISTFLDIYIERDLKNGTLTESRGSGTDRPYGHEVPYGEIRTEFLPTTSCSPEIRYGQHWKWVVSDRTDVLW